MGKHNDPLLPGNYYHIYNHGNSKENIFFKPRNYKYFLDKYFEYMYGYLETLAYCLLPNHFHLTVRVKDKPENTKSISAGNKTITSDPSIWQLKIGEKIIFESDKILSELLRRFFKSYSK